MISTALDCIGGFSDWLAMHPHLLPHVTPIVTSALTNPELSLAATMALKDISRDCTDSMKPYAEQVRIKIFCFKFSLWYVKIYNLTLYISNRELSAKS